MKKAIIVTVGIVLAILTISVNAQEMIKVPEAKGIKKLERIREQIQEKIGVNITPQQAVSKIVKGEVKLNITPYLTPLPVIPPIECPSFMVVELPFKAYFAKAEHYVIERLREKNLTLPQICEDKTKIESLVREAIEKINLTEVCKGLERASEHCREMRILDCEKINNATKYCVEGLKKCKSAEERVETTKKVWKEKIEEIEEEIEAQEGAVEEILKGSAEAKTTKPIIPKIEGIVPKCYMEEHTCERLREKYEKCMEFQKKCAPRCEVINKSASECLVALADKEALVEKVVEFILNRCRVIDFLPPPIEEVENETIAPTEIQPVIIVTQPLTLKQEESIRAIVEKLRNISKDEVWMYRALVRANKIEDLRKLDFVFAVKIDHIMRALQRGAFKELPKVPEFAPQVKKVLPALEGVKMKTEPELQPIITEVQIEILNHTKEIAKQHEEEKARGVGYAILKFLGLRADRERKDATFLEKKARSINKVVEELKNITKTEERPEIRAIIIEQIAELQKSVDEISSRANAKRKGALGVWSLFGLR